MREISTVAVIDAECPAILVARVSPRGDFVYGAGGLLGEPGWIGVWGAQTRVRSNAWNSGESAVTSLAVSGDQRVLATACRTTDSIDLWTIASQERRVLKLCSPPFRRNAAGLLQTSTHVTMMAFSSDDKLLAAGCWDMSAKIWDLESGSMKELFLPHRSNVDFVAFRDGGNALVSGTYQALFDWNVATGTCERRIDLPRRENWRHIYLEDQGKVASVSQQGTIRLWNPDDWSYRESSVELDEAITSLAHSERLNRLAIGLETGEVVFVETVEGRLLGRWDNEANPVMSLSFAPDDDVLWTVTAAGLDRFRAHRFAV